MSSDGHRLDPLQGDGSYPRPLLMRPAWCDLSGAWDFAFGTVRQLPDVRLPQIDWSGTINVPYPPESTASGISADPPEGVLWYRRFITEPDLSAAGWRPGRSVRLHFGAVDYEADVWLDGHYLGHHRGGQTPFTFDIGYVAEDIAGTHELVVRAHDAREDVRQPRGKQDWQPEAHDIWYGRTSGIWQPVWLESVPAVHLTAVHWTPHVDQGAVDLEAVLAGDLTSFPTLRVELFNGDDLVGFGQTRALVPTVRLRLDLPGLRNGQDLSRWLWTPEHPHLLSARLSLGDGDDNDEAGSYLGLRSVGTDARHFLLNGRPYPLRAVLTQGYWPETHLAAPSAVHLRREVELIKELGFNAARVHQKAEDPRFLHWADRLGLLVWGETAAAYEYSAEAVRRLVTEWMDLIERDRSHPSIVTWVPVNESWGAQHIETQPAQRNYAIALGALSRALDPFRPALTNDGWEHTASDLITIHDYEASPEVLAARYRVVDPANGGRACGRPILLAPHPERPVVLSEFGGVSLAVESRSDGWGYSTARDIDDYHERLRSLFSVVRSASGLAGFCYTQLCDTEQEVNGLATADRVPKLPAGAIRRLVLGAGD